MNATPAEVIQKWLLDESLGVAPPGTVGQWPCYVAGMPETGNQALCVYDTTGILQGRIQRTGETIETFGIQVRVRAMDYETGYAKAVAINEAFDELLRVEVLFETHFYKIQAVSRKTPIIPLGPESGNKRERFTINYLATIAETG